MTECQVARSCREWMLRQEKNDDRRLMDGMMEPAVDMMMLIVAQQNTAVISYDFTKRST